MWQKIKNSFRTFMIGRYGSDQLTLALLVSGIVLSLITSITGWQVFHLLGLVAYVWGIFRMFSRNTAKRAAENQKFMSFMQNFKTNSSQFINRLKNMKKYRYFHCPECKSLLRLPRKVGEVTVTCGKCHHQFRQKA